MNPFFKPFTTLYGVPPFNIIKENHYIPAIKSGIKVQKEEIISIWNNLGTPTFENTIEAIENSGEIIKRTVSVLYNLSYANTSASIQNIMQQVAPALSAHQDQIFMNKDLFKRVEFVWENKKQLKISGERSRLLELYYKTFTRNGANLSVKDKKRVSDINKRLTVLSLLFGQHILEAINEYQLIIDHVTLLVGIPESLKTAAKETAIKCNMPEKWIFTLQNTSVVPFLQYAQNRSLREEIWSAYTNKGNLGDKNDNNAIVTEIVMLRSEKAAILGYESHAHYVLEEQMSKTPDQVNELLNKLWLPAIEIAKSEATELQKMMDEEGSNVILHASDWRYYAEKLRKQKYEVDEEEMKPYFSLANVQKGVFDVAQRLYGLSFTKNDLLPSYHPDAFSYEVKESDGKLAGVLYLDFFPRESKQGGAWMTSYVEQKRYRKARVLPVISIVCNFSKPTADTPSLLTFDEVNTFFHEFGHALHGLLSDVTFSSLAGTSVPTDFVELPSQIMENWAEEPEVLKSYARHYISGDPIPDTIIEKMDKSRKFGQGFATVEYLAASLLDMSFHTLSHPANIESADKFEHTLFEHIGLMEEVNSRYKSTYFSHIFAGGYSSGYYSYIWSEVLDADAFALFKERGIFDAKTAESFRKNILSTGGTVDPMILYTRFRGQTP
ncbi:MAG: M3 family metallopeptidase, partial [Saprospiraceae bacterium]|nr:M3 family metallopeptidase [Saprospiraceae bacterium]